MTSAGKYVKKLESHRLLGTENGVATLENSLTTLQMFKNRVLCQMI